MSIYVGRAGGLEGVQGGGAPEFFFWDDIFLGPHDI
jgi:hypothetical protein